MALTDLAIRKAKPGPKPFKLSDEGGLHLLIQPNGSKLWRLKYRFLGREKLLSFGPYPLLPLADARRRTDEAKKLLLDGVDPSNQRRQDKIAARISSETTFGGIAREYLANKEAEAAAKSTIDKNRWLLIDLASEFDKRPIAEINAAEVLELLKRIEKSGRRESARRLRGVMGSVFRYAIVTLRAKNDPTLATHGALLAPRVQHRAAIVEEKRLGALMCTIDEYDGWPTIRAALQLLALTMTRPGDVRHMRRSEIDLERARWRIPAERMKMRRPHDVPLSKQALAILQDIWSLSDNGDLVLPAIRSIDKALSENAMNSALRRMGYTKDEMTAHGFRSAASTVLNERGYDPDVIEAALAHQDEDDVRRAYNRATYWPERVKLMQEWADILDSFRSMRTGSV